MVRSTGCHDGSALWWAVEAVRLNVWLGELSLWIVGYLIRIWSIESHQIYVSRIRQNAQNRQAQMLCVSPSLHLKRRKQHAKVVMKSFVLNIEQSFL